MLLNYLIWHRTYTKQIMVYLKFQLNWSPVFYLAIQGRREHMLAMMEQDRRNLDGRWLWSCCTRVRLLTSCCFQIIWCIYFWLHWFFFAVRGLSLVVASGGNPLPISWFKVAACALAFRITLQAVGRRRLKEGSPSLLFYCGVRASHFGGFSRCGAQPLGMQASVVVALRLSCPVACGIFPDQGSNLCPLHWQVDS